MVAKGFRVLQSSRPGFKPNDKAEWVAEIKSIYKKKGLPGLRRSQKNHKYLYEQGLWLFGGIDEAFRFVGLNPEEIRLYGSWEDERLHREIWNLQRQKLPLYPNYLMKHHQKVLSHALAGHGSWSKALVAHGIKPPAKRYRLHLLIWLREKMESGNKLTKAFSWELEYYFGSVEKAKLELKTDKRLLNGWGPKRVIVEIQKRHG